MVGKLQDPPYKDMYDRRQGVRGSDLIDRTILPPFPTTQLSLHQYYYGAGALPSLDEVVHMCINFNTYVFLRGFSPQPPP